MDQLFSNQVACRQNFALSIPIPPLPEQQRIVGVLDEAFEAIATAKFNGADGDYLAID